MCKKTVYILIESVRRIDTYYYHGEIEGCNSLVTNTVYSTEKISLENIKGYLVSKQICTKFQEIEDYDEDISAYNHYTNFDTCYIDGYAQIVCDILNSLEDNDRVYVPDATKQVDRNKYKYEYTISGSRKNVFCPYDYSLSQFIEYSDEDRVIISAEKQILDDIQMRNNEIEELTKKISKITNELKTLEFQSKKANFNVQQLHLSKISDCFFGWIKNGELKVHDPLPDLTFEDFRIDSKDECKIYNNLGVEINSFSKIYPMDLALLSRNSLFVQYLILNNEVKTTQVSLFPTTKYYEKNGTITINTINVNFWEESSNPVSLVLYVLYNLSTDSLDLYNRVRRDSTFKDNVFNPKINYTGSFYLNRPNTEDLVYKAELIAYIKTNSLGNIISLYKKDNQKLRMAIKSVYGQEHLVKKDETSKEMKEVIKSLVSLNIDNELSFWNT